MKKLILFLTILTSTAIHSMDRCIPYPAFSESLFLHQIPEWDDSVPPICSSFDVYCIHRLEAIYEAEVQQAYAEPLSQIPRIPQIIHQICWDEAISQQYLAAVNSWKALKRWEYRLWTRADIEALECLPGKERFEILDRYGGLYVDLNVECICPAYFEEWHLDFDCYLSMKGAGQPLFSDHLMGAIAHHPLIQALKTSENISTALFQWELKNGHPKKTLYLPPTFLPLSGGIFNETAAVVHPRSEGLSR